MKRPRLGINIDHVATLRQQRDEDYPRISEASESVLKNGADQITIHLREDRRHIQDFDLEVVRLMTSKYGRLFNLEMGATDEMIELALACSPDWICLVPEKREEKTTEGGLNILDDSVFTSVEKVLKAANEREHKIKVSLFIEASEENFQRLKQFSFLVDAVEIHTGEFARAYIDEEDLSPYISIFEKTKALAREMNLGFHAGHGLTDESLLPLLKAGLFEEYNIGHWVVAQSVFSGIGKVVRDLKQLIGDYPIKTS